MKRKIIKYQCQLISCLFFLSNAKLNVHTPVETIFIDGVKIYAPGRSIATAHA